MGSQNFENQENGKINLTKNCALQVYHKNPSLAMYNEHTKSSNIYTYSKFYIPIIYTKCT